MFEFQAMRDVIIKRFGIETAGIGEIGFVEHCPRHGPKSL